MPLSSPHRPLEILLLGGFSTRLNKQPVIGFAYNKMRALLAYLAVEREQDHNRDILAELLWNNYPPSAARLNLRRTLADLRRILELPTGLTLFLSRKHTIRFIPSIYIDTLDFIKQIPVSPTDQATVIDNLERKIALYQGEFLAGLSLPDCPDFEDWLQMQRETLHRHALSLLEQLSNYHEQTGNFDKALHFALRHTELEPWHEHAHLRTMRLYALKDQNSAAIHQYEICCRLLKDELGVLPTVEIRRLAERIRNGEFRHKPLDITIKTYNAEEIPQQLCTERRQTTVLFCELTIEAIDDPDETLEYLVSPQAHCIDIIRQFSGHVVQAHGGGLLAYFGFPKANEDAARRAVQAALAISHIAIANLKITAAVHTGLIITSGDLTLPDTVGNTSKIAIQLCHCANHNQVVISKETYRIVGGYFQCIRLGTQCFPGLRLPLEIFTVLQESGACSRLDASTQLTPLAGRQTEIAELMSLWEKTEQGIRQTVLIQGEAGIGKSRLLHTIKQRLINEQHKIRELRCFPEFSQSPFHPLIAMFETVIKIEPENTPEEKLDKLVYYVETHYPDSKRNAIPMLSQLLSLQHQPPSNLSPQKQKELTCSMLLSTLAALSQQQPVLLIVEDLHWADPSTLEFLTLLVEEQQGGAILAIFTARPDFVPPWNKVLTPILALAPLIKDDAAEIVAAISTDIPAATLCYIVEHADGIPLFIEEMAKIAIQDNYSCIPTTLHDLLITRIDSVREAKHIAQVAATIGREFSLDLLHKIYPYAPEALTHNMDLLLNAGLVLKVSEKVCQFKHALIQEAAYQSQTKIDRQTAHQRIAQALQSDFPTLITTQPEILAQHLSAGGEIRQSIEYWLNAGQRATLNSANTEAIEHLNNGLQNLMLLPSDNQRDNLELKLCLNLGVAFIATKGYGSVDAGQAYSRAMELSEKLNNHDNLYQALWGMWLTSSSRINHSHSLELAEKMLYLATQNKDPLQLQQAHYAMGNSRFWTGNPCQGSYHFETSLGLYQSDQHEAMARQFGENVFASSSSLLCLTLWLQGNPNQANEIAKQNVEFARKINHPINLSFALSTSAMLNRWLRQIKTTERLAKECMTVSEEFGLPFWLGMGATSYSWSMAMQGKTESIALIQQWMEPINSIMSGAKLLFLAPLCEALINLGYFDDALDGLNEALEITDEKNDRFFESEFHRLKGVCLLEISETNSKEAETCFNRALTVSHKQQAKSLKLRAAMSMAKLWRQQARRKEALQLLEAIYNEFTEGFDTQDLQEAAQLLHILA